MRTLRPMAGLRFSDAAGDPEALWAASPDDPRSDQSILQVAYPLGRPDDRSKYVRFATAMALLMDWRRNEIIAPETSPFLYRLRIGSSEAWAGLTALGDLDPGEVAPVDKVHPQRVLEATMTHIEFPTAVGKFEAPEATVVASGTWRSQDWELAVGEGDLEVEGLSLTSGSNVVAAAQELASERRKSTNWIPIWVCVEPENMPIVPMGLLSWSQNDFR